MLIYRVETEKDRNNYILAIEYVKSSAKSSRSSEDAKSRPV